MLWFLHEYITIFTVKLTERPIKYPVIMTFEFEQPKL